MLIWSCLPEVSQTPRSSNLPSTSNSVTWFSNIVGLFYQKNILWLFKNIILWPPILDVFASFPYLYSFGTQPLMKDSIRLVFPHFSSPTTTAFLYRDTSTKDFADLSDVRDAIEDLFDINETMECREVIFVNYLTFKLNLTHAFQNDSNNPRTGSLEKSFNNLWFQDYKLLFTYW